MSFSADLNRWNNKTKDRAEDLMQKVVIVSSQGVTSRNPVESGRSRASWNIQAGRPNLRVAGEGEGTDSDTDQATLDRLTAEAKQVSLKDRDVYLTNNMPYAMRLEYGWSDQATHGMVRVTAAEVRSLIAAGRLK